MSRRSPGLHLLVAIVVALLATPAHAQRHRPVQRSVFPIAGIDALVEYHRAEGGIPGISIAIDIEGKGMIARAYGWSSIENLDRVETTTIFQIASITKQFTAAAILRLEERGKLSVDDDIREWIPEIEHTSFPITIANLLNHTSGLPNYMETTINLWQPLTAQEVFDFTNSHLIRFDAGSKWEYNNLGYYLLGVIIERATGRSYAEFLEQELFLPLGLTHTSYCGRQPAVPVPSGYIELGGLIIRVQPMEMSIPFAAGALCSTAEDLVRWNRALSSGLAISDQSYERMTTPTRLSTGEIASYGYGLVLSSQDGYDVVSHTGSILGFNTHMRYLPELGLTVAVLTNVLPLDDARAGRIAYDLAELMISQILARETPRFLTVDATLADPPSESVPPIESGESHRRLVR